MIKQNKNYSITVPDGPHKGETVWISRSIALAGVVYGFDNDHKRSDEKIYILAEKRGPGCPDNVGKWCVPCGYLDYDETAEEGIKREIFEETGIDPKLLGNTYNFGVASDPKDDPRQNVTLRFAVRIENVDDVRTIKFSKNDSAKRGGEKNEVDELRWIPLDEVGNYDWAFGHDELIGSYFRISFHYIKQ